MDLPPLPLAVVRAVASGGRSLAVREMSAVQEIEAAIARLEAVKRASVMFPDFYDCSRAEFYSAIDRIVTLGCTIDVQLAILSSALQGEQDNSAGGSPNEPWATKQGLALARAINRGA